MKIGADIAVGFVALLHAWFLVLEMFLREKPFGRKTFGLTPEFATASKSLAANQGLYNGFLAAGLVWGLLLGAAGGPVKIFFLRLRGHRRRIRRGDRQPQDSVGTGAAGCDSAGAGGSFAVMSFAATSFAVTNLR